VASSECVGGIWEDTSTGNQVKMLGWLIGGWDVEFLNVTATSQVQWFMDIECMLQLLQRKERAQPRLGLEVLGR